MPYTQFSSQGSQLSVKISASYVNIPGVVSIKVPKNEPEFDDTTTLGSAGGFRERMAVGKAFVDNAYEIVWDPNVYPHYFLEAASLNQTSLDFQIEVTNVGAIATSGNAKYTFSGFISWEPMLDLRKAGRVSMTISVTGAVTRS